MRRGETRQMVKDKLAPLLSRGRKTMKAMVGDKLDEKVSERPQAGM